MKHRSHVASALALAVFAACCTSPTDDGDGDGKADAGASDGTHNTEIDFCDRDAFEAAIAEGVFPEEDAPCECQGFYINFSTDECLSNYWSCQFEWSYRNSCGPSDAG